MPSRGAVARIPSTFQRHGASLEQGNRMHIIGNQSVAALPRAAPRGPVANRGGTRRESILTLHNLCDIILNDMGVSLLHV